MMGVGPNNPAKNRINNCQLNHQHRIAQVPMPDRTFCRTPNPTKRTTRRRKEQRNKTRMLNVLHILNRIQLDDIISERTSITTVLGNIVRL